MIMYLKCKAKTIESDMVKCLESDRFFNKIAFKLALIKAFEPFSFEYL